MRVTTLNDEEPTVARLAQRIDTAKRVKDLPLERISYQEKLPLSFAQERLWFLDQFKPGSAFYNIPSHFQMRGRLRVEVLEECLNEIVGRHEALRTVFLTNDGNPTQVIQPDLAVKLTVVDLRELPETERKAESLRLATEEAQLPFNLSQGPLLRTTLLHLGEEEYSLLLTIHHVVFDGWSISVFMQELSALYEAFTNGKPSPLAELPIQYADFAYWQRQWLQGEVLETQLAYWKRQLGSNLPVLQLPTDYPRPALQTFRGAQQPVALPETLVKALRTVSQQEGVSLFMMLLTAFKTLLYRYTGQKDIVIGSPIANRNRMEIEGLIGLFVNNLVLRTNFSGNPSFRELLTQVREVCLGAYTHQDLPFEKLVEQLQPERNLSHNPLFQVTFALQNALVKNLELPGLSLNTLEVDNKTAKCDMELSLEETGQGLTGLVQYNTDLFDSTTICRFLKHFQTLLESIVAAPQQRLSELPLLSTTEQHQILVEWNNTKTNYPHDKCIHEVFEAQAELQPDAVAVVFEDEQLTYQELNQRANRLAHYLQTLGVKPEVLVGIYCERSLETVIALLGVLKADGAYMPLDPTYPKERLSFMLQDSQVTLLLTQQKFAEGLPKHEARVVCLDSNWEIIAQESKENVHSKVTANNLAYVIYTSGSTGKPKGVLLEHQGLCNLVQAQAQSFGVREDSRVLQFASFSFDASVSEIFVTLTAGATLYLRNSSSLFSDLDLIELLRRQCITVTTLPPSVVSLLPVENLPALQSIIVAGESASGDLVNHWAKGQRFFNAYGPTESTVCASLLECTTEINFQRLPIGFPIANTQIYLLDSDLQLVPIGVPGELHISSVGLARGYLNRPELTAEKFIPNPFSSTPGARLYKTGDLVRYLPNGNIEFLGRIDHQVKIRGFRVELGEIETVLNKHPAVRKTVVVARQDVPDRKYLAAYIVPSDSEAISRSDLRGFLKEKLPDYMIPGVFVMLDALPLTPNGKVDCQALHYAKTIDLKESETNISNLKMDIPPQNKQGDTALKTTQSDSIRSTLRSLVAKLLQIESDEIDVSATFLEMGTDSLLLLEAVRSIQTTFGVEVEVQHFFEEMETIDALATYIEQNLSLEREQKSSQQSELKPISVTQKPNSESSSSPQELAQPKALNVPVAVPKDKAMNRANKNVEPETSVERIISQQLQLISQQLELLRTERPRKEQSLVEKTTLTEFASARSFYQSATVTNPSPVCSYNEWDTLEEVIVGIVDGAMVPSWHTIHRATVLPGQEKQMDSLSKRTQKQPLPYPEWLVQAATKCVDEFVHILESEGVVVRRPDVVDYSASFRTPDWEVMNGFCAANPRDVFLVIGNEIIEAPMADRGRYFESWAYRSLLKEYLKVGAKWVAAPKPQLLDAQYDPDYKVTALGEEMRFVITEFEPTFDAADFVRFGRDIFVQKSHVTNSLGIEWVRRHLGDEYRVHEVQSLCPQALHIDTTLVPLAPGKVLVNPLFIDVDNLPDYFKSWDILIAPKPNKTPMTLYDTKVISQWVNMNVLSLDEERVIVEKSQESMIKALKDWGFKPIPCEFESYYPFLGSFHCATLDVRRRGVLRSYEMEEGAL
jgi:amino acid adenylation domain-containing protein